MKPLLFLWAVVAAWMLWRLFAYSVGGFARRMGYSSKLSVIPESGEQSAASVCALKGVDKNAPAEALRFSGDTVLGA